MLRPASPAGTSRPEWKQIVRHLGTWDQPQLPESEWKILEENLPGSHRTTLDLGRDYPGQRVRTSMEKLTTGAQIANAPSLTEASIIEFHRNPAHADTILAHLMRLGAHKPVKGVDKSSPAEGSIQTARLLEDYATRLVDLGVTELAIFFVVEHFIDVDEDFFPTFAKLKKAIA